MSMHANMKRHGWIKRQTGVTPTAIFDDPRPTPPVVNPPAQNPTPEEPEPPFIPGPRPPSPQPSQPQPSPDPPVERPPTPSTPTTPSPSAPVAPVPPRPEPSTPSEEPSIPAAPSLPPSPPPQPTPSTPTVAPSLPSLPPPQQTVVQVVTTPTLSPSSAVPSNTALSDTANSGAASKAGPIAGGIIGALIGVAGLFFVVSFVIRRQRKRHENNIDENPFDPQDFRKSAMILHDEDAFRPNPPVMTETRGPASPAPTFGTQYGAPPPANYLSANGYDYNFNAGPYPTMNQPRYMNSPMTATSAHPMWDGSANGSEPGTPFHDSQGPAQYANIHMAAQPMIHDPHLQRQPSVNEQYLNSPPRALTSPPPASPATPVSLQRQPSFASPYPGQVYPAAPVQPQGAALSRQASSASMFADDYLDLSRSSVSPYQAKQYAEISKQLGSDVPNGLDTPAANRFIVNQPSLASVGEEKEPASPLPNAVMPVPVPAPAAPAAMEGDRIDREKPLPSPFDDANAVQVDEDEDYDFPIPPSMPHNRVDSTPPKLPELHLRNGSASSTYDFNSPSFGAQSEVVANKEKEKFVPLPSPLAASTPITVPAPAPAVALDPAQVPLPAASPSPVQEAAPVALAPAPAEKMKVPATAPPQTTEFATAQEADRSVEGNGQKKRPDTMYTIYDPEDVYGGI